MKKGETTGLTVDWASPEPLTIVSVIGRNGNLIASFESDLVRKVNEPLGLKHKSVLLENALIASEKLRSQGLTYGSKKPIETSLVFSQSGYVRIAVTTQSGLRAFTNPIWVIVDNGR